MILVSINNIDIELNVLKQFIKFFGELVENPMQEPYLTLYENVIEEEPLIIEKPLQVLLKEGVSHDNLTYNTDYYVLNSNTYNTFETIRVKTILTKDNLVGILTQQPPLRVNDPLTRMDITSIRKIQFVLPNEMNKNGKRVRSRSIGGGKKSKKSRSRK